ncbi:MAG: sensor histidine kinase [Phycisphaerae bacterium]
MTSPRTIRRHAVLVLALVWVLVLGGLAWATIAALRVERVESREAEVLAFNQVCKLALSRLDSVVARVLYRESARKYSDFRFEYIPAHARSRQTGADVSQSTLVASPLQELPRTEWVLLHFMVSESDSMTRVDHWNSPQAPVFDEGAMSVVALDPSDRADRATPQNWLAALRDSYSLSSLLAELETAQHHTQRWRSLASNAAEPPRVSDARALSPPTAHKNSDIRDRGERLLRNYPTDQCVSEHVALQNLDIGRAAAILPIDETGCVSVTCTPMEPVWLDVTMEGEPQLAFLRTAVVASAPFCTIQGVLIDWPRLDTVLRAEVRDLLPHARIVPVPPEDAPSSKQQGLAMTVLPARLETGVWGSPAPAGGLTPGLVVAWIATTVALLAVSYGTMRYVSLMERRMRFVAAVTHELRTPLTTFQLYTDLLSNGAVKDPQRRQHYVHTLRRESRRLSRLVENVLTYARIGNRVATLNLKPASPGDLLEAVRSQSAEPCAATGKQLIIENRCGADTMLETDREFVIQILANLVDNACKYGADAADPRIWVRASDDCGTTVVFDVEDMGVGVASQDRRDIFRPFRRGRSITERGPGGMGLGLALSRYWAECLGGRLVLCRAERNQGRYSRFAFTLPVRVSTHHPSSPMA